MRLDERIYEVYKGYFSQISMAITNFALKRELRKYFAPFSFFSDIRVYNKLCIEGGIYIHISRHYHSSQISMEKNFALK
jgi:hypothetical protein